jgi:uncharacterized protein
MPRQTFVNLPVQDVQRTRDFFAALGFQFNPQFSNDTALCMVIADGVHAMLLHADFFRTFTKKPVADARQSTEVLVCLSCDSREEVDALVAKAVAAGGRTPVAAQDHGFMYAHGFEDLDGHQWELVWMSDAPPPQP